MEPSSGRSPPDPAENTDHETTMHGLQRYPYVQRESTEDGRTQDLQLCSPSLCWRDGPWQRCQGLAPLAGRLNSHLDFSTGGPQPNHKRLFPSSACSFPFEGHSTYLPHKELCSPYSYPGTPQPSVSFSPQLPAHAGLNFYLPTPYIFCLSSDVPAARARKLPWGFSAAAVTVLSTA